MGLRGAFRVASEAVRREAAHSLWPKDRSRPAKASSPCQWKLRYCLAVLSACAEVREVQEACGASLCDLWGPGSWDLCWLPRMSAWWSHAVCSALVHGQHRMSQERLQPP